MYDGVNALMRRQMSGRQLTIKKQMTQLSSSVGAVVDQLSNENKNQVEKNDAEKTEQKEDDDDQQEGPITTNWSTVDTSYQNLQQFVLSRTEMQSNLYPMEDVEGYARVHADAPTSPFDVLAIDCEMCTTSVGLELTKITVLDKTLAVIYDTFVKPERPILDHNTRYSGITAEMLADVTTTVSDVQEKLLRGGIVGANTVLVGHSLENDLHSLKIYHSRVADTAILFPHTQQEGHKNSLRYLAQRFLKEEIQQGSHDSEVDARTAMKLFLLKVQHGVHFGVSSMGDKQENILEVLSRKHLRSAVVDRSESCRQLAARDSDCFAVMNDDDAVSQTVKLISQPNHQFIFTHLRAIDKHNQHEESVQLLREQVSLTTQPTPVTELPDKLKSIFSKLDQQISEIWSALPRHCALLVVGAHGNMAHVRACVSDHFPFYF
jgi:RNA exonuclease 1